MITSGTIPFSERDGNLCKMKLCRYKIGGVCGVGFL